MSKHTHRIAQVTEWTGPFAGQTHICLIDKRAMGEDFVRSAQRLHRMQLSDAAVDNMTLVELHKLLEHTGKTLPQFGLPEPDFGAAAEEEESRVLAQ